MPQRTATTNLKNHMAGTTTTLAQCWRIQRLDNTVYCFTSHDCPIIYNAESYTPIGGGSVSDLKQSNTLSVDNQDVDLMLTTITPEVLRAGLLDNAYIWTFKINYVTPSDGIMKLVYGRLGEVEIRDNRARIEMRGLSQQLATPVGRIFTPECNASLGDSRCKVLIAGYTHTGTVSAVHSRKMFTVSGSAAGKASSYYDYGTCLFTSGANNGIRMQVEFYNSTVDYVTLIQNLPWDMAINDTVTLVAGCDRRAYTCKNRFANFVNFRGYPHLPGLDKTLVIPQNVYWTSY